MWPECTDWRVEDVGEGWQNACYDALPPPPFPPCACGMQTEAPGSAPVHAAAVGTESP